MRHLGKRIDTNSIFFRIAAVFLLASVGMTAAIGALGYLFMMSQQNLPYSDLNPWKIPPLIMQEIEDHEQADYKAIAQKFHPHLFAILDEGKPIFSNLEASIDPLSILNDGKPCFGSGPRAMGGPGRGGPRGGFFGMFESAPPPAPQHPRSDPEPEGSRRWKRSNGQGNEPGPGSGPERQRRQGMGSRRAGRFIEYLDKKFFVTETGFLTIIVQDTSFKGRKPRAILFATQVAVIWFSMLIVLYLVIRRLLTPLNELLHATREMGDGNLDYRIDTVAKGEFGILIESFNEMAHRLSAMFSNSRILLGNISHDLKYYITRMKMTVEVDVDDTEARISLNEDLDRLNQYIDRSLEAYRLNSRKAAFIPEKIDLSAMLRGKLETFGFGGAVSSEIAGGLFVDADPAHFSNVLDNLFDNAAKYGTDIFVSLKADSSDFCLVMDNGTASPPDPGRIDLLFEPFYRGDPSRAQEKPGTGLGLYLAREALDAMGFSISLASYPMKNRFAVTIRGALAN